MSDIIVEDTQNAQTNGTDIIVKDEVRIETVIIILWAAGGVLLLALLILLVCILKNNKKTSTWCGGRQSNVLRIVERGHVSRDGRDNQGYSNYDDIWTWIPVLRGSEDGCQRIETGQRIFTIDPSPPLTDNLEPPPYSVAISTPSSQASIAATSSRCQTNTTSVVRSQPYLPPL